ncbi:MAG: nucleoside transporter C-terminal domain-containing protein [Arenicellales bacterium]
MSIVQALVGLAVMVAAAWAISENRRALPWATVVVGLLLQAAIALVLLKLPASRGVFLALNHMVDALQAATRAGTSFVFGYLGGGALPFQASGAGTTFILGLQALPLVLVVSALSALLYHWRVLPAVVRAMAWALSRSLRIGGAASLATAANVFVGMIEAPLLIKPYFARLSRSDLFVVMTAGMATIAGTVLVLFATFLQGVVPDPAGQLLTASLMSAPAAVLIARVMVPPEPGAETEDLSLDRRYQGAMDAITQGTADGLKLLLNIIAMLVVLVALVHLADTVLELLPDVAGGPPTLERLLGFLLAPLAWLIGVPWSEAGTAGMLLGQKIVLNEVIAYTSMAGLPAGSLGEHGRLVVTYALSGFANLGSLGIMIGGLGAMAPERRDEIVALGMRSIFSGILASCMTGAVAGIIAG